MNLQEFLAPFGIKQKIDAELVGRSYFAFKDRKWLSKRPLYVGECLAHIRGPVLIPSTTFLQYISKHSKKHVTLTPKGEWLYICGRDVFGKSISEHNNPEIGNRVVVLNQHNECLGYGEMVAPLDEKRVTVKRLFDIGDLLRREKRGRR